jgi:hypothetical protein
MVAAPVATAVATPVDDTAITVGALEDQPTGTVTTTPRAL